MRKLVCEMCGSSDIVKEDGYFVCQSCGIKYTLEEAKKMMIEGTVEVKGTVNIDTSNTEAHYLSVLDTAIESQNYEEVYSVASKIVEINASNSKGWFYKGVGAGYTSRGGNNRFKESIACFDKAYSVATESEKEVLSKSIVETTIKLIDLLTDFYCAQFLEHMSVENQERVMYVVKLSLEEVSNLNKKYGLSYIVVHDEEDKITSVLFTALQGARTIAENNFGRRPEDKTDYKFDIFVMECDSVIALATLLIKDCPLRNGYVDSYYSLLQKAIRDTTHSCSFTYSVNDRKYVKSKQLTRQEVKRRNQEWEALDDKRESYRGEMKERQNKYQAMRNEIYWSEHAQEKETLLARKEDLVQKREPFKAKIADIMQQISAEKESANNATTKEESVKETMSNIDNLLTQKKYDSDKNLKKEHKVEIKKLKKELKVAKKEAKAERALTNAHLKSKIVELENERTSLIREIAQLDNEISRIDDELTKDR